jgi:hypothetical protein
MILPKILTSTVVRSAHKGESHGFVYTVDLSTETSRQVIAWAQQDIDWTGRGFDRGLRGIAFHQGLTYIAASTAILVYDTAFRERARFQNPYLRHCHEIAIDGEILWVTSTGFDALLALDLKHQRFTRAYHLGYRPWQQALKKLLPVGLPQLRPFDPNATGGPLPGDTLHLNSVVARDGVVYCAGIGLAALVRIADTDIVQYTRIPFGTHNAQPYRAGVLMNDTPTNSVCYADYSGQAYERWHVPVYPATSLLNAHLPHDYARPAFGRGLCIADEGTIIAGASPATVSVYAPGDPHPLQSLNLTRDVRYAIHGLEVYPY